MGDAGDVRERPIINPSEFDGRPDRISTLASGFIKLLWRNLPRPRNGCVIVTVVVVVAVAMWYGGFEKAQSSFPGRFEAEIDYGVPWARDYTRTPSRRRPFMPDE